MRWTDEHRTDFAKRMREARKRADLDQGQAAKLIGIKQGTLSELEKSATKSAHTAKAAAVYKVSPLWLQTGAGPMVAPSALSQRATFIAAALDGIQDRSEFEHACVLCEAFIALASAGQLATVAQTLTIGSPAQTPTPGPKRNIGSRAAAAPETHT